MNKTINSVFIALFAVMAVSLFVATDASAMPGTATSNKEAIKMAKKKLPNAVDVETCYECHTTISEMHSGSMHENVNCVACHEIPAGHVEDANISNRPTTRMDWEACGTCHTNQYETFMTLDLHRPARNDKSNAGGRSPNPAWDKVMAPHGFTKEHAVTRSHSVMMLDQFIVDRAFGGRFQPINGWNYIFQTGPVWDILYNVEPETSNQKAFMRQTATANNPVCMNCKTMDHILDWSYMGDPAPAGETEPKWSRTSSSVEMAQAMNHSLNCFFCHDPHSAEPRIVRDALIDAMTNPAQKDNLYQSDPNKVKMEVVELGERGFVRKIGILDKNDPRYTSLQCAQCHVEYNCNPGVAADGNGKFTMASRLANHFPLKDALHLYEHYYEQINFQDYKNAFSGAALWKGQHPEFETHYESKHAMAGVTCANCHYAPVMDDDELEYTSHFATSPRFELKATCLTSNCHGEDADENWDKTKYSAEYIKLSTNWTEEMAIYSIDSIKSYTKGRMRKAEFWLVELIDIIQVGERMGVSKATLDAARLHHTKADILWEYWTAENSDGFHNPELARESLTKSIDESMAGYKLVDAAIKKMTAKK